MAYKYKLNEMSKVASEEDAAKELDKPKGGFEVGQVSYSDDGQRKSTIYKVDPVTGAVGWKIEQLPGFDKLFDDMDELVATAKRVYVKTKDDKKFRDIYEEVRKVRNKLRTHLRNEYPDEYKRIVGVSEAMNEVDVVDLAPGTQVKAKNYIQDPKTYADTILDISDEILDQEADTIARNPRVTQVLKILKQLSSDVKETSMSGAAGAYMTPYAFRIPKKKKKKKIEEANNLLKQDALSPAEYQNAKKLKGFDSKNYKWDKDQELHLIRKMNEDYRGVEFEEYIDELEKTMYVERRDRGRFIIHPLDKPDVRRPSRDYIVIDGNNVTAVQGYNSGPISVLADRYGLDDEDDRMTDMGKTNASGRVSLLSSNILKDAIKAIEDSRDLEAKRQQDYYRERGPVSGVGNMDEGALGDGATLGPGPKAGPDGVTDSAYTKQFKYKLVKKNKDGTYVQKGSTLPVRKLWGE